MVVDVQCLGPRARGSARRASAGWRGRGDDLDPGPVNTGYLDAETADRPLEAAEAWVSATPFGRFGEPADPARLIGWLSTDAGAWVVGQVLSTDGGLGLG